MPFSNPNFTQTPNDLLGHIKKDEIQSGMMAEMGLAELKVTLAICRLTFGFHREKARASISDVMFMTGLSRQGVLNGATQAETRGHIKRFQDGGVTEWEAVVEDPVEELVNAVDQDETDSQHSRPVDEEVVNVVDQQPEEASQHSRPPSSKERRTKENKINKSELRSMLTDYFAEITCIIPPCDFAARNKLWWQPLTRIAETCDNDIERTKKLIAWTLIEMDKRKMTVCTPASIEKVATGEQARRKRNNENGNDFTDSGYVPAQATRPGETVGGYLARTGRDLIQDIENDCIQWSDEKPVNA